jgi:pyruvate dehydrogenase E2 component (dihydrolipoamide acetyltransferase)
MPFDVLLPQWGMGMNDGMIVKWLKQEGDPVEQGDPLVEIESSKVNGEVEAIGAGVLARIVVPEGMTVNTGTLLAVILAEGETADLPEPLTNAPAAPAPVARPVAASPARPAAGGQGGRKQVTPIARRIAKELGVDVSNIAGSGPGSRVTEEDVRNAAAASAGPETRSVFKLSGLRNTIARRMTESSQIPAVTLTAEVDVTDASQAMKQLVRDWRKDRLRPQFQDIILGAVVRALRDNPRANAHMVGDEVREIVDINLGFALAVPEGLVVPVIHGAKEKTLVEIARHVRDVTKRVKAGTQTIEDLSSGTFTVTSLASYGVDSFNALLNPPEVGILGVGQIVEKPGVTDGKIAIRSRMSIGLTFDHRAWDGAPAGAFLQSVSRYLEIPDWLSAA